MLRGNDVISDIIKNSVYRQILMFNISFSKGKKHDTASKLLKEYANSDNPKHTSAQAIVLLIK